MRLSLVLCLLALPAAAQDAEDYPKLGPNAVSITEDNAYLRSAPAPDYWAFSPFVKPQFTTSACSIATITAVLNGLAGLPAMASETVMSQQELLALTPRPEWSTVSAEGGDGVTWDQFVDFTTAALSARGMEGYAVDVFHPAENDAGAIETLRAALTANEASATDAAMVYFNQGVVTGDWDGPHIALVGAYDAGTDRVLILEVDQEWYVPYWTPLPVLLEAMLRPAPADQGVLEGQTGGLVTLTPET